MTINRADAVEVRGAIPNAHPITPVDQRQQEQNLKHENRYATFLLGGLAAQTVFADIIFAKYASEIDWKLPETVVIGFLAAVVIELIGLVYVVTRHLFPPQKV